MYLKICHNIAQRTHSSRVGFCRDGEMGNKILTPNQSGARLGARKTASEKKGTFVYIEKLGNTDYNRTLRVLKGVTEWSETFSQS